MSWLWVSALIVLILALVASHRLDKLRDRLNDLEKKQVSPPRCWELVIELKPRALLRHPSCAPYYLPVLERHDKGELEIPGAGRPLINNYSFRIVDQGWKMIWSDVHQTFMEKFEMRGRLLNVEGEGHPMLGAEPHVWLRFHNGPDGYALQMYIVPGFAQRLQDDSGDLVTQFPIGALMEVSSAASEQETTRRIEALVGLLKKRSFRFSTWSDRDVFENAAGELELYDPDDGYVSFADSWLRVKYKERDPFSWGSHLSDEHREFLKQLGTEKPEPLE